MLIYKCREPLVHGNTLPPCQLGSSTRVRKLLSWRGDWVMFMKPAISSSERRVAKRCRSRHVVDTRYTWYCITDHDLRKRRQESRRLSRFWNPRSPCVADPVPRIGVLPGQYPGPTWQEWKRWHFGCVGGVEKRLRAAFQFIECICDESASLHERYCTELMPS
jgi:hypothetical protein